MSPDSSSSSKWQEAVLSILTGGGSTDQVKKLRKLVLLSLQLDTSDKSAKKQFKRTIQALEENGTLTLSSDGVISLKKRKKSKDESKKKKRKKDKTTNEPPATHQEASTNDQSIPAEQDKNKPIKGNREGITRLFLGNLPFAVDEQSLKDFLPDHVTHIKWITDKETGKFYGSAFVEMSDSKAASDAVAMAGSQLMGRPIKINFAPAREGDVWPPQQSVVSGGSENKSSGSGGGGGGKGGGQTIKPLGEKPKDCTKLFVGNVSFDMDDDTLYKFFASVDAEVKAVRWLHHKDSGDFKGCGFVEFWNTEACEKAAALNGKTVLGRPIRIDWSD